MSHDQKVALCGYLGLFVGFLLGFWRGWLQVEGAFEQVPILKIDALLLGMQPLGQGCAYAVLGWWLFLHLDGVPHREKP
ncbi:MAG: hypothetical protein U0796_12510 [Gemmatales bacterium]